ncbi:DJ-1/PfpI family protein [Paenibacillus radicis (ex Gao et al. 2016)]|uniref:Protease n=1 Tax=Paenibacillus radicis (ex Gao et al. 2016) TaxID=1737354 RepID=A0A917M5Z6_9BACL|nr:DJ-1/PfpI family protein [Paenibacillus radicis (ex Gao et al. 2016)]GGG77195.1 protease [Paenibacillus radicis (ex Gao et al. 2016)]
MSKPILILTGDGAEVLEVYYPYYRVLEEGYEAVIASPQKKVLHTVVHDFIEGWDTYTEKPAHLLASHIGFADVNPADYAALIIPGGRAPEYIRQDAELPRIVQHFLDADKPVGAICHGAQVFLALPDTGYFKGRTLTAYNACKLEVERLGATYAEDTLHVDGKLVSGHAWPDLPGFMREFLKLVREENAGKESDSEALSL